MKKGTWHQGPLLLSALSILALFFLACRDDGLRFKIQYDRIHGLREKDAVLFQGNRIGAVNKIAYTPEEIYAVEVFVSKAFSNAVTDHSKFFIVDDPNYNGRKAIKMVRTGERGNPLQEGATIQGSVEYRWSLDRIWSDLQKTFEDLKGDLEQFSEELQKIPDSEEMQKLENELRRLEDLLTQSGKTAQEKFRREIFPRLKRELERLRERLRRLGREKEIRPLEVQFEKLKKI